MASVAVAVNGGQGVGGKGSIRAVKWALKNLLPMAKSFVLVHVIPIITSISSPKGRSVSLEQLAKEDVILYKEDVKQKLRDEVFQPYLKLCERSKSPVSVERLVLEDDDIASALLNYTSQAKIHHLVLGSCSSGSFKRKTKVLELSTTVRTSPDRVCNVHVVYKSKTSTTAPNSPSANDLNGMNRINCEATANCKDSSDMKRQSSALSNPETNSEGSSHNDTGSSNLDLERDSRVQNYMHSTSMTATAEQNEIEQLQMEIQATHSMYRKACEEIAYNEKKIQMLSLESLELSQRVNSVVGREENLRRIAAAENAGYLQAKKEAEEAKDFLVKESIERKIAEKKAINESTAKKKMIDLVFMDDKRYRRYSMDEIRIATENFSEKNVIGHGSYGKVYKCMLDHTSVAIKVLQADRSHKRAEFLKEIEILSQLRHPHIVLLLGACPETCCLVYEFMENGSVNDCILHRNGKPSLPWYIRFRIVFEIACGLSFLHNSKPDPTVHRDIKPGNILLDKNYVAKIGDVGLAKLLVNVIPDNVTEYRDSLLAGSIPYMDPEYQRTGTLRPKSDLYAFGLITLQILTARGPTGLLLIMESALKTCSLPEILDPSVPDWPISESKELVHIALRCTNLRCRDRPDLDSDVLPVVKKLATFANSYIKSAQSKPPSYFFCPILQDIMRDPCVAADGFTYERIAIEAWLVNHHVSPVTMLRFEHSGLTPNLTLRSAIQEWEARVAK